MIFRFEMGPPRNKSRVSAVLGGVISLGLCATCVYVLLGDGELSGGIPFLPKVVNDAIGRLMVGFGALLTGFIGFYAFYEAWTLHRQGHDVKD